jgi:stage II sporulation protein M
MMAKKNNLKNIYKNIWIYLKESSLFIYSVIILFIIFTLIGFFFQGQIDSLFRTLFGINFNDSIFEYLKEKVLETQGMDQFELILYIFFNNLWSSFFGMILGIFAGVFSIIATIVNAYLIGFVSYKSVEVAGFPSLWRLFPHGFFELPAIFISLGLGLRLGVIIFQKERRKLLRENLWNSLQVFIFVVIPLLIIAAIIEGTLIALIG